MLCCCATVCQCVRECARSRACRFLGVCRGGGFNWWELRDRYARYPIFMKFSIICTLCIYFCQPVRKCFKYVLQLQRLPSKLFGIDIP